MTIFAERLQKYEKPHAIMNREEATAMGMKFHETKHSMKRRTPWHDYSRKGTYMVTLVVEGRVPLLGVLKRERNRVGAKAPTTVTTQPTQPMQPTQPAQPMQPTQPTQPTQPAVMRPYVELSELGRAIRDEEILKIHRFYPMIDIWKVCIMPDHIHMIVRVNEDMAVGTHLGMAIAGFKGGCSKAAARLGVTVSSASADANKAPSPIPSLFEKGYNDKILLRTEQLGNWKAYLDDNPRRLLIKRLHPELFTVMHGMEVAGHKCQVVGNHFLLDIPDKAAVIVHRRYTDEENARLREEWLPKILQALRREF